MRKQSWTKRDPIKNYFPLPNEIYDLGLSRGAISVYSFLLRREDRKTYQCLLSYREIGEGVGMCVTTVRKYVAELEERSLIRTERTTVTTKDGRKRNGRLLYHILPSQSGEKGPHPGRGGSGHRLAHRLHAGGAGRAGAVRHQLRGLLPKRSRHEPGPGADHRQDLRHPGRGDRRAAHAGYPVSR